MLSNAVRRGDERFPVTIFDDFNRADSSDLGRTTTGYVPWEPLSPNWRIQNNRLLNPTSESNPVAVVNARRSDVNIEVDVSTRSGDGLALRVKDRDNYLRVAYYYTYSSTPQYVTETAHACIDPPVYTASGYHAHEFGCWQGPVDPDDVTSWCCRTTEHTHYNVIDRWTGAPKEPETHGGVLLAIPFHNQTRQRITGYSTSIQRRIYLERVENGAANTLNFWGISSSPHRLRVKASGSDISVYRSLFSGPGSSEVLVGEFSTSFNQQEQRHGIARRNTGTQGTAIDNFLLEAGST